MAEAIFISYRRDDSEGEAGRLFDDLVRSFGSDAVFMDVAGIKPGVDFRAAIEANVASCGVLLAVVGPSWASITGPDGKRRLEDPNDFVALEIASALRRGVPVIPVLVHDAKMPAPGLLPESLKDFSYRNSVELSHARWNSDVQLLEEALKSYVKPSASTPAEPVHATVPVQLPAPHPPSGSAAVGQKKANLPLMIGLGVIAAALIIAVVVYALRSSPSDTQTPNLSTNSAASPTPAAPSAGAPEAAAPATDPAATQATPATIPAAVPAAAPAADPATVPVAAVPTAAVPTASGFAGTWSLPGAPNGNTLAKLVITGSGASLSVHAYGQCQSTTCDWGVQPAQSVGQNAVVTFTPAPNGSDTSRTAKVTMHPAAGGLDVLVQNTFTGPNGSRNATRHSTFTAAQ